MLFSSSAAWDAWASAFSISELLSIWDRLEIRVLMANQQHNTRTAAPKATCQISMQGILPGAVIFLRGGRRFGKFCGIIVSGFAQICSLADFGHENRQPFGGPPLRNTAPETWRRTGPCACPDEGRPRRAGQPRGGVVRLQNATYPTASGDLFNNPSPPARNGSSGLQGTREPLPPRPHETHSSSRRTAVSMRMRYIRFEDLGRARTFVCRPISWRSPRSRAPRP